MTKAEATMDLSYCHWKILDEAKARELHIQLVKIDDNHAFLSCDIDYIPTNMSVDNYLDYIQKYRNSN